MNDSQPTIYNVGTFGFTVTAANVLVAVILIVGMVYDSQSVTAAVLAGAGYFTISTGLTVLALSRTLTDVIVNRQNQITERKRIDMHYRVVNPPAIALPAVSAAPPQLPSFVPPVEEGVRREAISYAIQLYGSDGEPDPAKVHLSTKRETPGRLRISGPSPAAVQYLVGKRILFSVGNGYKLNIQQFPGIEHLKEAL